MLNTLSYVLCRVPFGSWICCDLYHRDPTPYTATAGGCDRFGTTELALTCRDFAVDYRFYFIDEEL